MKGIKQTIKKTVIGLLATGLVVAGMPSDNQCKAAWSDVDPEADELVEGPFNASTESLSEYQVPEWYRDAKFGIFIHYGIYSVPAFGDEWYGHWMYMKGTKSYGGSDIYTYHKNTYGGSAAFGYKDFIPQFVTELKAFSDNNMADYWAELFKNAGAKYVMPVGMHHDSFALYNSDVQTTYNSVEQAGVDYVGQLQKACKDRGMRFGISNHFAENDWFFSDSDAAGTDITEKNEDGSLKYGELYGDGKSKSEEHIHKWYDISMEIINKYNPDLIYYDFDLVQEPFNKYDDANRYLMLANYYNQALTNNKDGVVCFNKSGAFTSAEAVPESERAASSKINPYVWQTDTSIGRKSWCYTTDEVYRSGNEFIGALVDIVSKNGNLLLNVGPQADGTIPDKAEDALLTIGEWLSTYGDAIYATRPWFIYGEGPSQNSGDNYNYTTKDIRFTKSKDNSTLYVTALAKPTSDTMAVTTLGSNNWDASTIKSISLINGSDREILEWEQNADALNIYIPDYESIKTAYSVEIKFNNDLIMPIAVDANGAVNAALAYDTYGITSGSCSDDGSETIRTEEKGYAKYMLITDSNNKPSSYQIRLSNDSQGTIELRVGGYDGRLIGKLPVEYDSDTGYRTVSGRLYYDGNLDELDLCIVLRGKFSIANFSLFNRTLNNKIEAESYDDKFGSVTAEACADEGGGENLGYSNSGDYVKYSSVDFGKTCNKLSMRLAGQGGSLDIRIDSPEGRIIASTDAVNTGSWTSYDTYEYEIAGVTGIHDVYLTFNSSVNVNWLMFSNESGQPDITITDDILIDDSEPFFAPEPDDHPQSTPVQDHTETPTQAPVPEPSVDNKVTLNKSKITIGVNEKFKLIAASTGSVSYSSSNSKVASVSVKGVIKGKKTGKAVITAKSAGGGLANIAVTVKKAPKKITVNKKTVVVKKGKSYKIKYALSKKSASYSIRYISKNKKVAKVSSSGVIKGVKAGKTTVSVVTYNKKRTSVKVRVY